MLVNVGPARPERWLGAIEGRRLAAHPVLWLSLLTTAAMAVAIDQPEEEHFLLVGFGLVIPAFVGMVLMSSAARRSRRSGTDELFATVPVTPSRRTVGYGLAALRLGAVGVLAALAVWLYRWPPTILGLTDETIPDEIAVPRPNLAQFLQGPMAMVVLGVFGLVLSKWVATMLLVPAMVVPAMAQLLWFGMWNGAGLRPDTWWWPFTSGWVYGEWRGCGERWATCQLELSGFDRVTPWWHLAYLVALAAWLLCIAVLRDQRDRRTWTAFGVATAGLVATLLVQAAVFEQYVPPGVAG